MQAVLFACFSDIFAKGPVIWPCYQRRAKSEHDHGSPLKCTSLKRDCAKRPQRLAYTCHRDYLQCASLWSRFTSLVACRRRLSKTRTLERPKGIKSLGSAGSGESVANIASILPEEGRALFLGCATLRTSPEGPWESGIIKQIVANGI